MEQYYTIYYYEIPSFYQSKAIVQAISRKKAIQLVSNRMMSMGVKIHVYYTRKGAF